MNSLNKGVRSLTCSKPTGSTIEAGSYFSRRSIVAALCISACARRLPDLPRFETYAAALPHETVGDVRLQPAALRGRVVLVTFMATWCLPCMAVLAVLNRLERNYSARGFTNVVIGMDLDGRKVLEPFVQWYQPGWPLVVADERLRTGQTPFGLIRTLPTCILFTRSGRVAWHYTGVIGYDFLAKMVAVELDAQER